MEISLEFIFRPNVTPITHRIGLYRGCPHFTSHIGVDGELEDFDQKSSIQIDRFQINRFCCIIHSRFSRLWIAWIMGATKTMRTCKCHWLRTIPVGTELKSNRPFVTGAIGCIRDLRVGVSETPRGLCFSPAYLYNAYNGLMPLIHPRYRFTISSVSKADLSTVYLASWLSLTAIIKFWTVLGKFDAAFA